MHHPIDRIAHTTAFDTSVMEHWLEREIAQWVHPMKDRSDDPSHHDRTLLPRAVRTIHSAYGAHHYSRKEGNVLFKNTLNTFYLCVLNESSQCSTTGVTKAVVCVILSVGWCI